MKFLTNEIINLPTSQMNTATMPIVSPEIAMGLLLPPEFATPPKHIAAIPGAGVKSIVRMDAIPKTKDVTANP